MNINNENELIRKITIMQMKGGSDFDRVLSLLTELEKSLSGENYSEMPIKDRVEQSLSEGRVLVEDTHTSHTIYIEKELLDDLNILCRSKGRGFKTRFLNVCIEKGLDSYKQDLVEAKEKLLTDAINVIKNHKNPQ